MKLKEAMQVAKQKETLIRTHQYKGAVLDEVIIAPSDPTKFENFARLYVCNLNAQEALVPFINDDLIVIGVFDKARILKEGVFIFSKI